MPSNTTRHQAQLEAIAFKAESMCDTSDEIRAQNKRGWNINVRHGNEGPGDTWTYTEGIVLDADDLQRVINAVAYIRSGDWHDRGELALSYGVTAELQRKES